MSEEGYQGYENWETWNVSLWLSNDEGLYYQTIQIMQQNPPRYSQSAKAYFADDASKALEEYVDELLDENIIKDKISLHRVNWQEVMMGFESEVKELTDDEGEASIDTDIRDWIAWFKQVDKNPDGNYA